MLRLFGISLSTIGLVGLSIIVMGHFGTDDLYQGIVAGIIPMSVLYIASLEQGVTKTIGFLSLMVFLLLAAAILLANFVKFDQNYDEVLTNDGATPASGMREKSPLLSAVISSKVPSGLKIESGTSIRLPVEFRIREATATLQQLEMLDAGVGELDREIRDTGWAGIGLADRSSDSDGDSNQNDGRQLLLKRRDQLVAEIERNLPPDRDASLIDQRRIQRTIEAIDKRGLISPTYPGGRKILSDRLAKTYP